MLSLLSRRLMQKLIVHVDVNNLELHQLEGTCNKKMRQFSAAQ